jgi:hypothetical protein
LSLKLEIIGIVRGIVDEKTIDIFDKPGHINAQGNYAE